MQLLLILSTANFTLNNAAAVVKNKCCRADSDRLIEVQQRLLGLADQKAFLSTPKAVVLFFFVFFNLSHVFIKKLLGDLNRIEHNTKTVLLYDSFIYPNGFTQVHLSALPQHIPLPFT